MRKESSLHSSRSSPLADQETTAGEDKKGRKLEIRQREEKHGCPSHRFLKFLDFSLTFSWKNVNFPCPTDSTISQISPDNGTQPSAL